MLLRNCANFRVGSHVVTPHFGSNQSYHNSLLKNSKWREKIKVFQITMLLVLVGLFVGLLGLFYWSRRKFLGLPGAGLQLPLIGHYQVSHGFWLVIAMSVKASDWSLPAQSRLLIGPYQVSQGFWLVITRSVKGSDLSLTGESRVLFLHYQVSKGFWLVTMAGLTCLPLGPNVSVLFSLVTIRSSLACHWALKYQFYTVPNISRLFEIYSRRQCNCYKVIYVWMNHHFFYVNRHKLHSRLFICA